MRSYGEEEASSHAPSMLPTDPNLRSIPEHIETRHCSSSGFQFEKMEMESVVRLSGSSLKQIRCFVLLRHGEDHCKQGTALFAI